MRLLFVVLPSGFFTILIFRKFVHLLLHGCNPFRYNNYYNKSRVLTPKRTEMFLKGI